VGQDGQPLRQDGQQGWPTCPKLPNDCIIIHWRIRTSVNTLWV